MCTHGHRKISVFLHQGIFPVDSAHGPSSAIPTEKLYLQAEQACLELNPKHAPIALPSLPSPKYLPANPFFSSVPAGNLQRLDGHHVCCRGLARGEGMSRDVSQPAPSTAHPTGSVPPGRLGAESWGRGAAQRGLGMDPLAAASLLALPTGAGGAACIPPMASAWTWGKELAKLPNHPPC